MYKLYRFRHYYEKLFIFTSLAECHSKLHFILLAIHLHQIIVISGAIIVYKALLTSGRLYESSSQRYRSRGHFTTTSEGTIS